MSVVFSCTYALGVRVPVDHVVSEEDYVVGVWIEGGAKHWSDVFGVIRHPKVRSLLSVGRQPE
jgi:hypothetical protein